MAVMIDHKNLDRFLYEAIEITDNENDDVFYRGDTRKYIHLTLCIFMGVKNVKKKKMILY